MYIDLIKLHVHHYSASIFQTSFMKSLITGT